MFTIYDKKMLYESVLNTFGLDMQMMVCIEEFSELMKEFSKYQRITKINSNQGTPENIKELKEEIVDASIMVEQMRQIFFDNKKEYFDMKNKKLKRLALRLGVQYEPRKQVSSHSHE